MMVRFLKKNLNYIILLLLLIICFIIIFNTSFREIINNADNKVINFINTIINTKLTNIMKIITLFGDIYIPLLIIVCIFIFKKKKIHAIILSFNYIFAGLITQFLKILISRPRPIESIIKLPNSFSFPSGHSLTSIVFYFTLWYLLTIKSNKKIKIFTFVITLILVLLIGFSRIYLKVHFFSDVIGGFVIGIILIFMIVNLINMFFKENL